MAGVLVFGLPAYGSCGVWCDSSRSCVCPDSYVLCVLIAMFWRVARWPVFWFVALIGALDFGLIVF
jgi:hypothetical protein